MSVIDILPKPVVINGLERLLEDIDEKLQDEKCPHAIFDLEINKDLCLKKLAELKAS